MSHRVIQDDCINVLSHVENNSVHLIYADPPFCSGKDWTLPNGEIAFSDKWGSTSQYLQWLGYRIENLRHALRPDGSFYLHIDPKISHHVRFICDRIFGEGVAGAQHFQREIIWRIGWISGYKSNVDNWCRNHDTILFYTKSPSIFTFNRFHVPRKKQRRGKPAKSPGIRVGDVWNASENDPLNSIQIKSLSTEKTGWPTQKPESLLSRIIQVSSNTGDTVLDPFCGSGTTLAAGLKLGRDVIGLDTSSAAVQITEKRCVESNPKT